MAQTKATVLGDLRDIWLVSHKADFRALIARGPLVTPDYTFYNQLVEWQPNEIVRDLYPLARKTGASAIRYGLYRQRGR